MRDQLSAYLNTVITGIIIAVIAATPLLFINITSEFYEMPKIIFLSFTVLVLLLLWGFSWVLKGKVVFSRTPLDIPLILLLGVILVSTFFSDSRFVSIFGNYPRLHGSTISWVAYILFYFIAASNLKTPRQLKMAFSALMLSSVVMAIISIASYFGLYLPFPFAKFANFSTAGSSFSTTALLAMLLPLPLLSIARPNRFFPQPLALIVSILFGATIALIGDFASIITAGIAVLLIVLINRKNSLRVTGPMLAIPVVITVVLLILSAIPMGNINIINKKSADFVREIQLPVPVSWKVAASAFRDAPFFGTGPSTFLFNYTAYKPVEVNTSPYWNTRFDTSYNEFFQFFGTVGGLGLIALGFLSIVILNFGWKGLSQRENPLTLALSMSAVLLLSLLLFHVSTPVLIIEGLALLAMLMASHKSINNKVEELTIGIRTSKLTDSNLVVGDILPLILLLPIVFFVIFFGYHGAKAMLAEYYHQSALVSASQNQLIDTYNKLVAAENMNVHIDRYRTDIAQTNFALANAIAAAKGPTEASPSGSLTDQDKLNIQQLLSQSITEARVATVLSSRNSLNWEVLASIYRQITGVAENALAFSLDAYGNAIQRDPLNPVLRLNVGGIYYSIKNYDLAIRFFTDAINLKPDYANAYYNLSIALRDKGDLQSAQAAAERVVSLVGPESADYQAASAYLSDLKARIATGSAAESNITPPAAQQTSTLQNQQLPQVLDLPKPDKIATPEAVKKPKTSPSPSPSPKPTTSASPTATP